MSILETTHQPFPNLRSMTQTSVPVLPKNQFAFGQSQRTLQICKCMFLSSPTSAALEPLRSPNGDINYAKNFAILFLHKCSRFAAGFGLIWVSSLICFLSNESVDGIWVRQCWNSGGCQSWWEREWQKERQRRRTQWRSAAWRESQSGWNTVPTTPELRYFVAIWAPRPKARIWTPLGFRQEMVLN